MEIFDQASRDLIKKGAIDPKSRGNKLIKGFSSSIRDKILKETDYDPEDFATHDYERIKRKALDAYIYKEKRKRYIEATNPEYIKLKKEHLDTVIQRIVPNRRDYFSLPVPLKPLIDDTQHIAPKKYKRALLTL